MRKGRKTFGKLILIALILVAVSLMGLAVDGLTDEPIQADLIVVPGNKVEINGEPSGWLRARLDRTAELFHAGQAGAILVSGGTGKEGFAEAMVMRGYLLAAGVDGEAVYVDNLGDDTWLTARHAAELMQAHGWSRALVVTQFYHIPRMKLALSRWGVGKVGGVHARGFFARDLAGLCRELAAMPFYALRRLE